MGESLFKDEGLGTSGMSCNSCHADFGAFNDTFAQSYPHAVSMAEGMFGLDAVDAEQMVQLCMVVPMEARPLAWESRELAAPTAYVLKVQADFTARPPAE
jgi:cytochrome c